MLAFFDGIGTAALALEGLGVKLAGYFSWEVDPECRKVVEHHFPFVQNRGDVAGDDPAAIATAVQNLDSENKATIVLAAGPPCPDFSVVNSSAQGRFGQEGHKFDLYCDLVEKLEPLLTPRKVVQLCENVICQNPEDAAHFSKRLQAQPVVIDAADIGPVSRPRLFWTRKDWTQPNSSPITAKPLRWGKQNKLPRLLLDGPTIRPADIQLPSDTWFDEQIISGAKKVPCFTTPSPGDEGRAPPKRLKGNMDPVVRQRW